MCTSHHPGNLASDDDRAQVRSFVITNAPEDYGGLVPPGYGQICSPEHIYPVLIKLKPKESKDEISALDKNLLLAKPQVRSVLKEDLRCANSDKLEF